LRYFYLTRPNELGYPGELVYFCAPKRTRVTWVRRGREPKTIASHISRARALK
jgi:hypothetical protein